MDVWVLEVNGQERCDEYEFWVIKGVFTTFELAERFAKDSGLEEKYGEWVSTKYELNEGRAKC